MNKGARPTAVEQTELFQKVQMAGPPLSELPSRQCLKVKKVKLR